MNTSFPPIGGSHAGIGGENSFWPSFTDIMMVVTMIFLMATSILVVRNWQLVAELQESIAAEQIAAEMIETTSQENATLEERLANAEQSNSILRLRLMKRDEELQKTQTAVRQQGSKIASLVQQNRELSVSLEQTQAQLASANLEIDAAMAHNQELSQQLAKLNRQIADMNRQIAKLEQQATILDRELAQQKIEEEQTRDQLDATRTRLEAARGQVAELTETNISQRQDIAALTEDKALLNQEVESYNRQLLTLKGDYEIVKSKYEELIKPARSARGKYIAEVYYVKGKSGNVIRYRQPGDPGFSELSLAEVETRLAKLKQEQGDNLYVKIVIPTDSGLSYSEAWAFMRSLLVKYDYYYQE